MTNVFIVPGALSLYGRCQLLVIVLGPELISETLKIETFSGGACPRTT